MFTAIKTFAAKLSRTFGLAKQIADDAGDIADVWKEHDDPKKPPSQPPRPVDGTDPFGGA